MQNVLNLLKLQIDNKTDILKTKSPKKMAAAVLKALTLIVIASVVVWFIEGKIFVLNININSQLVAIILLVTQIISLVFAVGHIVSILYLNKDNEMLICFPVTANELFASKVLLIYLKEIAVNAMILVPIFFWNEPNWKIWLGVLFIFSNTFTSFANSSNCFSIIFNHNCYADYQVFEKSHSIINNNYSCYGCCCIGWVSCFNWRNYGYF